MFVSLFVQRDLHSCLMIISKLASTALFHSPKFITVMEDRETLILGSGLKWYVVHDIEKSLGFRPNSNLQRIV